MILGGILAQMKTIVTERAVVRLSSACFWTTVRRPGLARPISGTVAV
jgi:hypothetical protein